jgi:hypothetical protein
MRQSYYLRQRKIGGSIHVIFVDPLTGQQTDRSTGTNDEKKAHAIAQGWLANGLPDKPHTSSLLRQRLSVISFTSFGILTLPAIFVSLRRWEKNRMLTMLLICRK